MVEHDGFLTVLSGKISSDKIINNNMRVMNTFWTRNARNLPQEKLTKCALCVYTHVSPHTHCHISNRFLKEIAVGNVKYPLENTMWSIRSCWSSLIRRTNSVSRSLPGFLHRSAPSQWLTEEELTNYQWVFLLSSRHGSQDCLSVDHPPQSRLKYLYNYWMEALW